MHRVMLKYSRFKSKTGIQVKAEFTETCPLADWCPAILSFQTGIDAILLNYMCMGVCERLQSPPPPPPPPSGLPM